MSAGLLRVALTGGIATGKSYVLARFADRGVPTIDADRLARQALEPGTPGWAAVRRRFGPGILQPDEAIDRRRLAEVVFADEDARAALEAIVHPEVYRRIEAWFAEQAGLSHSIAVADIPLLFETGHQGDFDRIVVAACGPETQLERVMSRDGLSKDEAGGRIAAQWPIGDKIARADYVIDTGGTMEATDRQVEEAYRALLRDTNA